MARKKASGTIQEVLRQDEPATNLPKPSGQPPRGAAGSVRVLSATTVVHTLPGRTRLRVPPLKSDPFLAGSLETLLKVQPGVTDVTVTQSCASLTVNYNPTVWTSERLCRFLHSLTREDIHAYPWASVSPETQVSWTKPWLLFPGIGGALSATDDSPAGAPMKPSVGMLGYVSLAVGTALLAVPMVPGIPFLLLSSYCFAKSAILKTSNVSQVGEPVSNAKA
jgi:hypothetical protein